MNKTLILVVEDDTPVHNLITTTLKTHDYKYISAKNGAGAIMEASTHNPDIVLLDLGLPDIDGVEVIEKIRSWSNMPIIVISARSEDSDKIEALDAGADDYLTKPFSMEELLLRIEAVLRRSTGLKPEDEQEIFKIGKLTFNSKKQTLFDGEEEQKLTTKESELLRLLCLNVNKVLERNYALKNIWADDNYFNARSMDVYITKLRKHLKKDPSVEIINVHGKGYKLIL